MIDLIGTLRWIYKKVNQIFSLVNALLVLQETGGSITTDGTEQEVYRVETPMGVFEPAKVQIDFSNNTAAETIRVRVRYRITGGGAFILKDEMVFAGVQDPALKNIELEPNRHGIRVSIERLAGGAWAYEWAVFFRS